jgi:serine/threonine-protein kinase RsbT
MNRTTLGRFDILVDADLNVAVLNVQSSTQLRLFFSTPDLAMITTVASELGRNILKYGGGRGYLLVTWIEEHASGKRGVELKAVDYGPGFADTESALKDHYSTGGTLGLGLSGAARIMDSVEIDSKPGRGAKVTATKWTKGDAR